MQPATRADRPAITVSGKEGPEARRSGTRETGGLYAPALGPSKGRPGGLIFFPPTHHPLQPLHPPPFASLQVTPDIMVRSCCLSSCLPSAPRLRLPSPLLLHLHLERPDSPSPRSSSPTAPSRSRGSRSAPSSPRAPRPRSSFPSAVRLSRPACSASIVRHLFSQAAPTALMHALTMAVLILRRPTLPHREGGWPDRPRVRSPAGRLLPDD
jgi:hypothetical protein